ncbi:MAG: hypothetical protein M5U26_27075 [Planctomycetota bacterium]|nr:hypothetical protein [Planctomycetota bacterium]
MRIGRLRFGVLALGAALCLARAGRGGEEVKASQSAGENAPLATTLAYRIERSESGETRLQNQPVAYMQRIPSDWKLTALLGRAAEAPERLMVLVPKLEREQERAAGKESLRIDAELFDQRLNGKTERRFGSKGTREEAEALRRFTASPWYELLWSGSAWTQVENVAEGTAWPFADRLALGRELVLYLPPLPDQPKDGAAFKQVVVLPFSAPVAPAQTAVVEYKVASQAGDSRDVALTFLGSVDNYCAKGFEWGGIRLNDVRVQVRLQGSARVAIHSRELREASLTYSASVETVRGPDAFKSEWRLRSAWKQTSP